MSNYDYYELRTKLEKEQLGTCCDASIYDAHILKKSQKMIKLANKQARKLSKGLEKFKHVEITPEKEIAEIQGILRSMQAVIGRKEPLPEDPQELMDLSLEYEKEIEEMIAEGATKKATVFMKDETGHAIVSSHLVLGQLKEAAKITTNNGNKNFMKTKVSIAECFTLDVKVVEDFIKPSKDIIRDDKGERVLLERPIRFERMGVTQTAIACSEQLPAGTEFKCTLRVRKGSPITQEYLEFLLDMGKNCGYGSWRSSGNMGKFCYQLKPLPNYVEPREDGWK